LNSESKYLEIKEEGKGKIERKRKEKVGIHIDTKYKED